MKCFVFRLLVINDYCLVINVIADYINHDVINVIVRILISLNIRIVFIDIFIVFINIVIVIVFIIVTIVVFVNIVILIYY